MPEYKKKKVKKRFMANKKPSKTAKKEYQDIKMQPKEKKSSSQKSLNVVKGKKLERIRKVRLSFLIIALIVAILIILSLALPVGIAESANNLLAQIGTGSYPYELYGTETLNAISSGNYYYVLTDTNLNICSNNGKRILTASHGFSNPVLKTSSSRALLFEQGGNNLFITNLKKTVNERTFENKILNADISRCASYVVATASDGYASVVSVYNKKDELLYEWYSAEESVNNVTISANGKKIAVTTISAVGGKLSSKLYVFEFDSPNPVFTFDYGDKLIYTLNSYSRSGFYVITSEGLSYITWSKYKKTDYTNDLELSMFRNSSNGTVLVYNRTSNKSDNHIVVFSSKGEKISEFDFEGDLSDIQISRNHIYCISDTVISLFSKEGELLRTAECDFGAVRLAVLSGYSVAVISNDDVSRVEIESKKEGR